MCLFTYLHKLVLTLVLTLTFLPTRMKPTRTQEKKVSDKKIKKGKLGLVGVVFPRFLDCDVSE